MPYRCKEDNWIGEVPKQVIDHLEEVHNVKIIEPSSCIVCYTKPSFSIVRFGIYLGREDNGGKWRIMDYICDEHKKAFPTFHILLKHVYEEHGIKIFRFKRIMPIDPYKMLEQASSNLQISERTTKLSKEFLDKLLHHPKFQGKHRNTLAALALYVSCIKNNERRSQEEIARKCGIAGCSLQKNYKIFRQTKFSNYF
jgi:hypothetical protein